MRTPMLNRSYTRSMKANLLTTLLILGSVSVAVAQDQPNTDTQVFTSYEMGITFNYPNSWETKSDKTSTTFYIPLEGFEAKASMEIFAVNFRAEPDIWMISQKTVEQQSRREVVRQWQEEILGVPLLLTQTSSNENDEAMTYLSGLVYSATSRKMVFRLICPTSGLEKANFAWRSAMQSLRTTDGTLPKPEDPNRPVTATDLRVHNKPPTKIGERPAQLKPEQTVRGPVTAEVATGGQPWILRAPAHWTITPTESGFELKHGPSLIVMVNVASTLDSPPTHRALLIQSAESLGLFSAVSKREETGPKPSKAGADMAVIWRNGTFSSGKVGWSLDAAGQSGTAYWLAHSKGDGELSKAIRNQLTELINVLLLEPKTGS